MPGAFETSSVATAGHGNKIIKKLNKAKKLVRHYRFKRPGRNPASMKNASNRFRSPRYRQNLREGELNDADYQQYQKFLDEHKPL